MRDRKWLDKHKKRYIHNEPSAAVLNGVAALFHSTNYYVFALITSYYNGIIHKHALVFRQMRVFLFQLLLYAVFYPFIHNPQSFLSVWQCYIGKYP